MLKTIDLTNFIRTHWGPRVNIAFQGLRLYQSETELYYRMLRRGEVTAYGRVSNEYRVDLLNRPVGSFSLQNSIEDNAGLLCDNVTIMEAEGILGNMPSRPEARPDSRPAPSRPEARPDSRPAPSRPEARPDSRPAPSRPEARPTPSRPEPRPASRPEVPSRPTVRSNQTFEVRPMEEGHIVLNTPVSMSQVKPLPVKAEPVRKMAMKKAMRRKK